MQLAHAMCNQKEIQVSEVSSSYPCDKVLIFQMIQEFSYIEEKKERKRSYKTVVLAVRMALLTYEFK